MSLTIKDKLARTAAVVAMIGGLRVAVPVVKDLTELRNGTHRFEDPREHRTGAPQSNRIGKGIETLYRLK